MNFAVATAAAAAAGASSSHSEESWTVHLSLEAPDWLRPVAAAAAPAGIVSETESTGRESFGPRRTRRRMMKTMTKKSKRRMRRRTRRRATAVVCVPSGL